MSVFKEIENDIGKISSKSLKDAKRDAEFFKNFIDPYGSRKCNCNCCKSGKGGVKP